MFFFSLEKPSDGLHHLRGYRKQEKMTLERINRLLRRGRREVVAEYFHDGAFQNGSWSCCQVKLISDKLGKSIYCHLRASARILKGVEAMCQLSGGILCLHEPENKKDFDAQVRFLFNFKLHSVSEKFQR